MAGKKFENGYALIVGVGADLPNTVNDAEGLAKILQDAGRCAYPRRNHVQLLTAKAATRQKILDAFDLLAARAGEDATAIIYFSGHGYTIEQGATQSYYLMPYGYDVNRLSETAISDKEFAAKIDGLQTRKLLVLLDCCHAGGLDVITDSAQKKSVAPAGMTAKRALPERALSELAAGGGRVIITSSRADELSYAGEPYSAFTTALVESLCGKGTAKNDGKVRVADLAMYASYVVPTLTNDLQHPTLSTDKADNYAVAFYAAGAEQAKSLPTEISQPRIEQHAGAGDFAAAPTFDQRWQKIETQINNAGQIGFQNLEIKAERVYQAGGDMTFNEN